MEERYFIAWSYFLIWITLCWGAYFGIKYGFVMLRRWIRRRNRKDT